MKSGFRPILYPRSQVAVVVISVAGCVGADKFVEGIVRVAAQVRLGAIAVRVTVADGLIENISCARDPTAILVIVFAIGLKAAISPWGQS